MEVKGQIITIMILTQINNSQTSGHGEVVNKNSALTMKATMTRKILWTLALLLRNIVSLQKIL